MTTLAAVLEFYEFESITAGFGGCLIPSAMIGSDLHMLKKISKGGIVKANGFAANADLDGIQTVISGILCRISSRVRKFPI